MRCVLTLAVLAATALAIVGNDTDSCDASYHCVSKDATCAGDFVSSAPCPLSAAGSCCRFPLHCVSGKCRLHNNGDKCRFDSDCAPAHYGTGVSACQSGRCVEQRNANDACTNTTQCFGGMPCTGGKCAGFSLGQNCTPSIISGDRTLGFSCAFGLYCDSETNECESAKAVGTACQRGQCAAGAVCSAGVCVGAFSVDEGQPCTDSRACNPSLYCSAEGKCAPATNLIAGECSKDSDCGKGTTGACVCSHQSGKRHCVPAGTDNDCADELKAAYKCWADNKCAPVASRDQETCAQIKCLTVTNKIFACAGQCGQFRTLFGSCLASTVTDNCPLVPTWAKIMIAFGVLIALIAIVAIIFVVFRSFSRRSGYQPVNEH
eukprot:m51a1_g67 putative C-tail anchored protein (376) ;mRNA; r:224831-226204